MATEPLFPATPEPLAIGERVTFVATWGEVLHGRLVERTFEHSFPMVVVEVNGGGRAHLSPARLTREEGER